MYTIYQLLWMFYIYACLGWCIEEAYHAVTIGNFVNRGFLNGPVCPIYGCGALLIVVLLTPLKGFFSLFLGSFVLTTAIELVTGYSLKKIYHTKWWDYSKKPFNLGGYICLEFSLVWGLSGVMLMRVIHPFMEWLIKIIPYGAGIVLLIFFSVVFLTDCTVSFLAAKHLGKNIAALDSVADEIRMVSDEIGNGVYRTTIDTEKKVEEIKSSPQVKEMMERSEELTKKRDELVRKYSELYEKRNIFRSRLIKAFPDMKSEKVSYTLEKMKEELSKKRSRKE